MFFIVPERKSPNPLPATPSEESSTSLPPQKRQRLSPEPEVTSGYYPKRVPKACDRCRLKKARCSGGKICDKCKRDGVICTTNRESKREPTQPNAAYVQLVESQRDCLLRALNGLIQSGLSQDRAALAKTLQELGIRVEDLKRAPRQKDAEGATLDLDDISLYQNPAEIQALLDECSVNRTKVDQIRPTPDSNSQDTEVLNSYLNQPCQVDRRTDFSPRSTKESADALSSLDMMFLPLTESDGWLAPDGAEGEWSLPVVDFVEEQRGSLAGI